MTGVYKFDIYVCYTWN